MGERRGEADGHRQRHRNLTTVLLAELPAILPGDANGMNALLRESRVVDEEGAVRRAHVGVATRGGWTEGWLVHLQDPNALANISSPFKDF